MEDNIAVPYSMTPENVSFLLHITILIDEDTDLCHGLGYYLIHVGLH